jgi:xanthosine utilization system XapX-like protein
MIPGLGKDDLLAGLLGIVILYAIGQICDRLVGKQEKFSRWLWDGIVPFIFTWFVVWIILINYASVIY